MKRRLNPRRMALLVGLSVPMSGLTADAQDSYRVGLLNAPAPLLDAPQPRLGAPEVRPDAPATVLAGEEVISEEIVGSEVVGDEVAMPIAGSVAAPDAAIEVVQERYPDGKVKIRREMTLDAAGNYILHGAWTMWDPQGHEVASGQYQNGKRDGLWTRQLVQRDSKLFATRPYDEYQGPFTSQATFKNGQLHGKWIISDNQKRKISEIEFVDGARDGVAVWYFASGKKMKQVDFHKGLIDGQLVAWDMSGKVVADETYQEGRKLAPKVAKRPSGHKKSEGLYLFAKQIVEAPDDWWNSQLATYTTIGQDDRHGRWVSWYPSGQKEYEGTYENDRPEGQFTWWYPNSQVRVTGSYKNGKADGEWSWWYENGQKSERGQYVAGEPTGSWAYWKTDGMLHHKSDFDDRASTTIVLESEREDAAEADNSSASLAPLRGLRPSTR